MASAVTGSPFVYGAAPAWAWRRLNASCRRAGPGVTATASANASIARPGATILPHSWWAGLPGKPLDVSLLKGKILLRKTQNTTSHSLTLRSGDCDCSNAEMPSLTSHRCFRDFFEMHNLQPNENAQSARNNVDGAIPQSRYFQCLLRVALLASVLSPCPSLCVGGVGFLLLPIEPN